MDVRPKLIRKIENISTHDKKFIPIENTIKDMAVWEQYAAAVIDYTSKSSMSFITSYAPENIVGEYVRYPLYGDCPDTYTLKTYGKWWRESEAYQQDYMPQEVDPLGANDYITLGFEIPVVPRDVCIYETFNPGAVVRIWGRYTDFKWKLLWEGPPQMCLEESRKFHPKIGRLNCLINEIRLEFNTSHLKNHPAIDAVLLGGYKSSHFLQKQILQNDLLNWKISDVGDEDEELQGSFIDAYSGFDYISNLPHEVILHIFQYLDLKSLSRCAQVNRIWYKATLDPILYQHLSLKRYWHKIKGETLNFFCKHCRGVRKLDLSWCGNHDKLFVPPFINFFQHCCQQLTHLSLNYCRFLDEDCLSAIGSCKELTELRLRGANLHRSDPFHHLSKLSKLITLDLGLTCINDDALIDILKNNKELKHLNLDLCEHLNRLDQVVEIVATFNKNLTTWSSFKAKSLTIFGALHFGNCSNLKELDLGWCLLAHPGDCLERIALGCKKLRRLILCCWRGLSDQILLPIVLYCLDLTQLDLLGIKTITADVCERALRSLRNLQLLDISYCDSISDEQVELWRQEFPDVVIQRSCQFEVVDYLN